MAEHPVLGLWTDAYLGDTHHLTLEEHGAYLLLLMLAWRSRTCDLPNDDTRLAAMLRIGPQKWTKLKRVVMEFWTLANGRWVQKRLMTERERTRRYHESKVVAGRAGGAAKALKTKKVGLAKGVAKSSYPSPNPSPSPKEVVLREQRSSSTLVAGATDFDEWYKLFPRKKARLAAERAYKTARTKASREQLLDGVKRYVVECQDKEQQHIAHPATWLNGGRWLDESGAGSVFDADKAGRERRLWLREYAIDGRWVENKSGNGVWKDIHGVGPPPHDERTLVTDEDLVQFPKAIAMRERLKKIGSGEELPLL